MRLFSRPYPILFGLVMMIVAGFFAAYPASAITYQYDDLNRLTSITYDNSDTIVYSYDPAGNITRIQVNNSIDSGDVNNDGHVNLADAMLVLEILASRPPSSPVFIQADVNGDGKLGHPELSYILQRVAGF